MAVMICFSEVLLVFENEAFDQAQVMRLYATIVRQENRRLQPEFAVTVRGPNMNMRRLVALVGIEMKSE